MVLLDGSASLLDLSDGIFTVDSSDFLLDLLFCADILSYTQTTFTVLKELTRELVRASRDKKTKKGSAYNCSSSSIR